MCDLGYIIRDHVGALMQVLAAELRTPYVHLDTTKCLNTAFTTMYMMLGNPAAEQTSAYCDVHAVRARVRAAGRAATPRAGVVEALASEMLDPGQAHLRTLYYVMLTDGYMPRAGGAVYFPGHVFVVERLPRGTFNLYQSYVGEYDLGGTIERHTLSRGRKAMARLLRGLGDAVARPRWDARTTAFWRSLTDVDSSCFEGCELGGDAMLVCYRAVRTDTCVSFLRGFLRRKLAELRRVPPSEDRRVHGPPGAYGRPAAGRPRPLTNAQVREDLGQLLAKLD